MKYLILSFLFFLISFGPVWKLDFNEAKMEAQASHHYILLNFSGSDWCGPCIKLTKDVFESSEFQDFAEKKLVLVRADFPRQKKNQLEKQQIAKNEALAEKYNQNGVFPLTVLLDTQGKKIREWQGYQPSKEKLMDEITASMGKP